MEIGAFFILIIVAIVVVIIGGILYGLGWIGQRGKLHPADGLPGDESGSEQARPEHRRVTSEQHTEFVQDR
jgi:hypothetical protein